MRASRLVGGMTLIEVLVALTLLSVLSVGVISAFRTGRETYVRVVRESSASDELLAAQRSLRSLLENAQPHGDGRADLRGSAAELSFTAPMPQSAASGGFNRYRVWLDAAPGRTGGLRISWSADPTAVSPREDSEILLPDIRAIDWSYFGELQSTVEHDAPRWLESWTRTDALPALVRLRVTFFPGDKRTWPDLIVSPRISAGAECQYDAVARICREAAP